jgi:hypothetical protein
MAKIKILRDFQWAADERDPYIVELSRVPCVGETIHTTGRNDPSERGPSAFVVTSVMHYANLPDLAAAVGVTLHEIHAGLAPAEGPKEEGHRIGSRRRKSG